jgi:hypothetical protein
MYLLSFYMVVKSVVVFISPFHIWMNNHSPFCATGALLQHAGPVGSPFGIHKGDKRSMTVGGIRGSATHPRATRYAHTLTAAI